MTPLELAQKYMDCIFETGSLEKLRSILCDDLVFNGPLYKFRSADSYINSLRNDPPKDFNYRLIKSYGDETAACLLYEFSKPGVSTPMSQLFETRNGKISHILLVFDADKFKRP